MWSKPKGFCTAAVLLQFIIPSYSLFILDGLKTGITDTDLELKSHDWVARPFGAALATHCLPTFSAMMLHGGRRKSTGHYTMSLEHHTSVHCTTKTTKLLFCNLLESNLLGNPCFFNQRPTSLEFWTVIWIIYGFSSTLCVYPLLWQAPSGRRGKRGLNKQLS